MEEYVKISLERYMYYLELEQNKRLKKVKEFLAPCLRVDTVYGKNGAYQKATVNRDELTSLIKEAVGMNVVWE